MIVKGAAPWFKVLNKLTINSFLAASKYKQEVVAGTSCLYKLAIFSLELIFLTLYTGHILFHKYYLYMKYL